VTLYDISIPNQDQSRLNSSPSCISSSPESKLAGLAVLPNSMSSDFSLFSLSESGSIHRFDVGKSQSPGYEWSQDLEVLHQNASKLRTEAGTLGDQLLTRHDFSPVYQRL
jgi:hypothetical protein